MSVTSNLQSTILLTTPQNKWVDGDSIKSMCLIVQDVATLAVLVDDLAGGSFPFAEHITDTTQSTSDATGALIVDGGVGIKKDLFITGATNVAGAVVSTATTDSTTSTTGAIKTAGGLGVAKAIVTGTTITVGTSLIVSGTTDSTTSTTGSVKTAGGLGVAKAIFGGSTINATTLMLTGNGAVGAPSFSFTSYPTNGVYSVSSTQTGFATSGALVGGYNATGLFTGFITEQTTGSGITLSKNIIKQNTYTALNSTGTITAAMVNKGGITSTSAAAVTATLDTAANIATQIGAVQGTSIEFLVDNTAGSNTVTVAVAAGIVAATPIITGGATLTVANSATQGIGIFRLVFSSASAAVLFRIG